MRQGLSVRHVASAATALVAILLSGLSLGLHTETRVVGQRSLEPTIIYFSEHTRESGEEHLHAEAGFERFLCLACILSLRDDAVSLGPATMLAGIAPGRPVASTPSRAPKTVPRGPGSSRAPPSA